jgi:hypothetical protein
MPLSNIRSFNSQVIIVSNGFYELFSLRTMRNMMNTIQPLFPIQSGITKALNKLSPEQRATYDNLLSECRGLINGDRDTFTIMLL